MSIIMERCCLLLVINIKKVIMVIKLIVGRKKDFCVGNLYLETNSMTFDVYIVRCVIDRIIVYIVFLLWAGLI